MSYYTQNGDYIRNPSAYAKTGAPMYKTKYEQSKNINEKHYIYKLDLEYGKKYIGKTTDIDRRMEEHFSGNGSKVTKKFEPIEGEIIDSCNGYFSDKVEQKHTNKYINKYGYKNVRGGSYTNSKTLKKNDNSDNYSGEYDDDSDDTYNYSDEYYDDNNSDDYSDYDNYFD